RAVIRRGYRWKIRSSEKINIWSELWLPDKENFFMEALVINGIEDMTAKDLLIPGLKEWDAELLGELFGQRDVSEILSISIKQSNLEDKRIWGLSRNGEYTVRSGYRVAMERIFDQSQHHVQGNWTELWNVEAPPCVKVLLWRVTRNVLPNRMALQQRRILIPEACCTCGRELENNWHLFLYCEYVVACWTAAGLWSEVDILMEESESMAEWLFKEITGLSKEKIC
ncbi:Putative ribonuclease H protein At1g65750, partial [Linum perenne]